jgi:metal-responsive CopG/Arc/MetJ family transcriptional regulator
MTVPMPKTKPANSDQVVSTRYPLSLLEDMDRLLETKKTDYIGRSDLIRHAVFKEVEVQRLKVEGRQFIEDKR